MWHITHKKKYFKFVFTKKGLGHKLKTKRETLSYLLDLTLKHDSKDVLNPENMFSMLTEKPIQL